MEQVKTNGRVCGETALFLILMLSGVLNAAAQAPPDIQWQYAYDWNANDITTSDNAYHFQPTPDGGYVAVGNGFSGLLWDSKYRVLKLNASGIVDWDKTFGDSTTSGHATAVCPTSDGGYIVIGNATGFSGALSATNHGAWDILVLKLDAMGNLQWHKNLGGIGTESAGSVKQTTDGGYIISGSTSSVDGDVMHNIHLDPNDQWSDLWLVRLDPMGNITWEKTFGSSSQDEGAAIQLMPDGGFVVCGYASANDGDVTGYHGTAGYPDGWVIRVNALGILQWQRCFGSVGSEYLFDIKHTSDNGFIAAGFATQQGGDVQSFQGGYRDAWMLKLDDAGQLIWAKTIGGSGEEMAGSVVESSPGKYVIAGQTNSADGDVQAAFGQNDVWAVKTDATGNILWKKMLGGTKDDGAIQAWSSQGLGVTAVSSADHGIAIAASTASPGIPGFHDDVDFYIIKLTPENECDTTVALQPVEACSSGFPLMLSSGLANAQYYWNTGMTDESITVPSEGTYFCTAVMGCLVHTDTFVVTIKPPLPELTLKDSVGCTGQYIRLQLSGAISGLSYQWNTGATTPAIDVKDAGTYTVKIDNGCETKEVVAEVHFMDCSGCIFVPNAFTPNGDGVNDVFRVVERCSIEHFSMQIYNRWGEQVFSGYNTENGWDGTYKGLPAELGGYYYAISYHVRGGLPATASGDITVVR